MAETKGDSPILAHACVRPNPPPWSSDSPISPSLAPSPTSLLCPERTRDHLARGSPSLSHPRPGQHRNPPFREGPHTVCVCPQYSKVFIYKQNICSTPGWCVCCSGRQIHDVRLKNVCPSADSLISACCGRHSCRGGWREARASWRLWGCEGPCGQGAGSQALEPCQRNPSVHARPDEARKGAHE